MIPHAVVTALAPEMLERARRLRVDVPLETPVVYAGTLHFRFEKTKAAVTGFAPDALHIRDETELARRETAQHIGALGPPRTLLVEPVESGPIILRTPRRDPTR